MKVVVYINKMFEHQILWCGAFIDGLKACGIDARVCYDDVPRNCDYAIMWSHGPKWSNVIKFRQENKLDYIVLDRGCLGDQMESATVSINGLHGNSTFKVSGSPDHRSARYKEELYKNWKKPGKEYVLLIGQLPGDASLQGLDIRVWLGQKYEEIKADGYEVAFKPHPRQKVRGVVGIPYTTAKLDAVMKKAICVYTYSSTAGVDAMLAGRPVIAESPVSRVYELAGHSVADIGNLAEPEGREQWFNDLAYSQWSLEEFRSGEVWNHLMEMLNG